jgi:hypothetical protein
MGMNESVELVLRVHTDKSSTLSAAPMEYFSLPLQCFLTGAAIIAAVSMSRAITRTNRRIALFDADLSALKTSLPAPSAPVADKLRVPPTTGVKVHQVGTAPHNAVVTVSTTPDLQLALNQLNAAFDAVMVKLDRIEVLVDALSCKTAR